MRKLVSDVIFILSVFGGLYIAIKFGVWGVWLSGYVPLFGALLGRMILGFVASGEDDAINALVYVFGWLMGPFMWLFALSFYGEARLGNTENRFIEATISGFIYCTVFGLIGWIIFGDSPKMIIVAIIGTIFGFWFGYYVFDGDENESESAGQCSI